MTPTRSEIEALRDRLRRWLPAPCDDPECIADFSEAASYLEALCEQEPVAWRRRFGGNDWQLTEREPALLSGWVKEPLYAAPRPAVSLTDEQIIAIRDEHLPSQGEPFDCLAFARAVLAAVIDSGKEKP